ncbi:MAG TPA: putative peptidoglycan glycosyltransferase FtsW [Candidatus Paceibacterota bacterium]
MSSRSRKKNRRFFFFIIVLAAAGFLIFSSASLGLLSRDGASYTKVVFNQLFTLLVGLVLLLIFRRWPYHYWLKVAPWLLIVASIMTLLVFVPGIGFASGGAHRWISLGSRTFQPSELLKFSLIIFLAAWLSKIRDRVTTWRSGFTPFLIFVGLVGALLIAQPDIGTFLVLLSASMAMFFVAGAKWRQLLVLGLITLIGLSLIIMFKPYVRERVLTFFYPDKKIESSAWQINQSLIAIGAGGPTGRGFGQSLQKFNYLPEPIGDSIFAVASEEFGLLGGGALVTAFTFFVIWGLRIAARAPDRFGQLLVVGFIVLMTTGAFINIASMLGLFPLTGIPLLFVSHGGSALLFSMLGAGVILNVARESRF